MGAKLWASELKNIKFTYDVAVDGGATGTIALGNLPDGFLVTEAYCYAETALVGGGSLVVGEDGGGDADGYFTDLDAIGVGTAVSGTGAKLVGGLHHVVDAAEDGVQITIASTAYTVGKLHFHFIGLQPA
jgi:hypothetical protein